MDEQARMWPARESFDQFIVRMVPVIESFIFLAQSVLDRDVYGRRKRWRRLIKRSQKCRNLLKTVILDLMIMEEVEKVDIMALTPCFAKVMMEGLEQYRARHERMACERLGEEDGNDLNRKLHRLERDTRELYRYLVLSGEVNVSD